MGNLLQTFLLLCLSLYVSEGTVCICHTAFAVFQQAVETGFGLQFAELPCIDSVCENKYDRVRDVGGWVLQIQQTSL